MGRPMLLRALTAMRLLAPALIAVTLAAPAVASQPVPRLIFNLVARGFILETYVMKGASGQGFVFFQGETVHVDIEIFNTTSAPQRVDTTGIPALGAFRLISREDVSRSADVMLSATGHLRHTRQSGAPKPVEWGSVLDLEPGTGVTWQATFEASGEPGIYRWQIELPPLRSTMPLSLNSSLIDYELRAVTTFADRAELLRRKVVHALSADDPSTERAALELLKFYPESHWAHATLGRRYRHAGRSREARRHYDAAIRLLKEKRDRLYLEHFVRTMHYTDPIPILRIERNDVR